MRVDSVDTLQNLLARGAQLIEVLPEDEYREEHLPGAINVPLKQLDAETAVRLDKRRGLLERLSERDLQTAIVTTPEGRLLGVVRR